MCLLVLTIVSAGFTEGLECHQCDSYVDLKCATDFSVWKSNNEFLKECPDDGRNYTYCRKTFQWKRHYYAYDSSNSWRRIKEYDVPERVVRECSDAVRKLNSTRQSDAEEVAGLRFKIIDCLGAGSNGANTTTCNGQLELETPRIISGAPRTTIQILMYPIILTFILANPIF